MTPTDIMREAVKNLLAYSAYCAMKGWPDNAADYARRAAEVRLMLLRHLN